MSLDFWRRRRSPGQSWAIFDICAVLSVCCQDLERARPFPFFWAISAGIFREITDFVEVTLDHGIIPTQVQEQNIRQLKEASHGF